MSNPQWRETRPSRPYGGGSGPRGRDPREPTGALRTPRFEPAPRVPGDGDPRASTRKLPAQSNGHRGREPRGSRRSSRPGRWGSLRGGAGVGIIAASAAVGAAATIAMRAQPGRVLGACIVIGTLAAALTVRPRAGRMIYPVPALSYLIAAFIAGIVYNRSASKTELIIGAAQWIANGFFLMALATVLAIALTVVRWYLGDRGGRGQAAPDWSLAEDGTSRRAPSGRDEFGATGDRSDPRGPGGWNDPGPPGPPRPPRPQQGQRPQGSPGPDQSNRPYPGQRHGPYPDQRAGRPPDQGPSRPDRRSGRPYDQQPGSGPYNFSSGA